MVSAYEKHWIKSLSCHALLWALSWRISEHQTRKWKAETEEQEVFTRAGARPELKVWMPSQPLQAHPVLDTASFHNPCGSPGWEQHVQICRVIPVASVRLFLCNEKALVNYCDFFTIRGCTHLNRKGSSPENNLYLLDCFCSVNSA